jgi:hypothetical protein
MRTRTYYRGPDAVVTSELFVWRTSPAKTFVIRELKRVGIARCDAGSGRPHTVHAAAGPVLVIAAWPILHTSAMVSVGAVVAVAAVVAAGAVTYRRLRPRLWELHGIYRNAEVILYASTDARVFNQVARALRRAMEDADPRTAWDGERAA